MKTSSYEKAPSGESSVEHGARRFEIIVMAASMGGIDALRTILGTLPADLPVPIAIVQHRTATRPTLLAEILDLKSPLKVIPATQGAPICGGIVYVAPPDHHLVIEPDRTFSLKDGRRIHYVLSSANPLFMSAAAVYNTGVIAVVLTGEDADGCEGVESVHNAGGVVIAQDFHTSVRFSMPRNAIATGGVDYVLPLDEIGPMLLRLLGEDRGSA